MAILVCTLLLAATYSCKKKAVKVNEAFIGEWYGVKSGVGNDKRFVFRSNGKADYDLLTHFGVEVENKRATIEDDVLYIKEYSFNIHQYPRTVESDTVFSTDTTYSITYGVVFDATLILDSDTLYRSIKRFEQ